MTVSIVFKRSVSSVVTRWVGSGSWRSRTGHRIRKSIATSPERYPKSDTSQAVIHDVLSEGSVRADVPRSRGTGEQRNRGTVVPGRPGAPNDPAVPSPTTGHQPTSTSPMQTTVTSTSTVKPKRIGLTPKRTTVALVDWDAGVQEMANERETTQHRSTIGAGLTPHIRTDETRQQSRALGSGPS